MGDNSAIAVVTGLVAAVTGFQMYKESNEFFFSQDCKGCDGTGKMTCSKCRGYGYLKKGEGDTIKAFKASSLEDVSSIYLCPFCKGQGTANCMECRGKGKLWPGKVNVERLFKLRHIHQGASDRAEWRAFTAEKAKAKEIKRKMDSGLGGFKLSGNANYLPWTEEDEAAAAAAEQAK